MKLIRATLPVGERILWIAAIFEWIGSIVLYPISCPRILTLRSMKKDFSGASLRLFFCTNNV